MPLAPDFEFLPLGAIIQSFLVPTSSSGSLNIVQSFPTAEDYEKHNSPYFGETIGRIANRVAGAKIKNLNGKDYQLAQNDGENALHGGEKGWGKRTWKGPEPVGVREIPGVEGLEGGESVRFTLLDKHEDQGYPGTVEASVVYTTGLEKVDGVEKKVLGIEYEVKLVDDGSGVEETAVNVTNHSYFNLSGGPTIDGTQVKLSTNLYLPLASGIPTTATPELFPNPLVTPDNIFRLSTWEPQIDDCFVIPSHPQTIDTRTLPLRSLVTAFHPSTAVHLEVLSTEPAFQFYTGAGIDVPFITSADGSKVKARGSRSGFCVEPSRFVDAVNRPEWREQVVLSKGAVYGSRVVYKGWCSPTSA